MSRIDDALKRMTGGTSEARTPSMLERFASEGKPTPVEEPKKALRADDHKVAAFVPQGPHPVDTRPPAPKVQIAPPPFVPPVAPTVMGAEPAVDEEKLIDVRQIADYVGFVLGSL